MSPTKPQLWSRMGNKSVSLSAANPIDSGAATLAESADYIRFVNPGDLRSARVACASCHAAEVDHVQRSMMAHGAMLWGAALYNNGAINRKTAVYGESYSSQGLPQRILPAHGSPTTRTAVSYTHLDVYKRQVRGSSGCPIAAEFTVNGSRSPLRKIWLA